ncbi:hypothetical protein ACOMHN_022036 [Nucella lapillus]
MDISCGNQEELENIAATAEKLGVSAKDLFRFRRSWKAIRRKMEDTGVEMFVRLFKYNQDLKGMFTRFEHLKTEDELRTNEALENHATLVMMTLDDVITHIDNFDYVDELLRKTAATHTRLKGFSSELFWKIQDPFLGAVKITLGDRYTENMEAIYKVALTFVLQTMMEGMEEALVNSGQNSHDPGDSGGAPKTANSTAAANSNNTTNNTTNNTNKS